MTIGGRGGIGAGGRSMNGTQSASPLFHDQPHHHHATGSIRHRMLIQERTKERDGPRWLWRCWDATEGECGEQRRWMGQSAAADGRDQGGGGSIAGDGWDGGDEVRDTGGLFF
ncbi:hypothetical protein VPH35_116538 [Triticum aestivum]